MPGKESRNLTHLDLIHIRGQIPPPSAEFISETMRDTVISYEQSVLGWLEKEKKSIADFLLKFRASTQRQTGRVLSPPVLCADFIMANIVRPLEVSAEERLDKEEYLNFALGKDIAYGIAITINKISIAESQLAEGDQDTVESLTQLETDAEDSIIDPPSITQKTELYIRMEASSQDLVPLLREDPSGFKLLDSYVQQLKEQPNKPGKMPQITHQQTAEFVIAGAELAVKVYKALYPLTQKPITS